MAFKEVILNDLQSRILRMEALIRALDRQELYGEVEELKSDLRETEFAMDVIRGLEAL